MTVLGWEDVPDVWQASIAQGVFEGTLFGAGMSVVFAAAVGFISNVSCPHRRAAPYLLGIVVSALLCWLAGGAAALLLALLSPEFYRSAFVGVPTDFGDMLGYAWVGGSIWGIEFGGAASVILAVVIFRAKWRSGKVRQ